MLHSSFIPSPCAITLKTVRPYVTISLMQEVNGSGKFCLHNLVKLDALFPLITSIDQ